MATTTYFKVLAEDAKPRNGGNQLTVYSRPRGKRPGKWMPKVGRVRCCSNGYHVTTLEHLRMWFGPKIWVAEVRGASSTSSPNKSAWEQIRLVAPTYWCEEVATQFMFDCIKFAIERVKLPKKQKKQLCAVVQELRHAPPARDAHRRLTQKPGWSHMTMEPVGPAEYKELCNTQTITYSSFDRIRQAIVDVHNRGAKGDNCYRVRWWEVAKQVMREMAKATSGSTMQINADTLRRRVDRQQQIRLKAYLLGKMGEKIVNRNKNKQ